MKSNLFSVNLKFCHQQQENTKLLALVNSNGTQDLQSIKQEVRCDQVHYHKSVTECLPECLPRASCFPLEKGMLRGIQQQLF